MAAMSADSKDASSTEDIDGTEQEKTSTPPPADAKQTLLGHSGPDAEADDEGEPPSAGDPPPRRRGRGQVTIPGGSGGRGQYWGKVRAEKTKVGMGETTEPIRVEGAAVDGTAEETEEPTKPFKIAEHITQELHLDEIQDVPDKPPPPKRKGPPRRLPRKPGAPPSRPAPPTRDRTSSKPERPPTVPPPRKPRSEPPPAPKKSVPPPKKPSGAPPPPRKASVAPPPKKGSVPPPPVKRSEAPPAPKPRRDSPKPSAPKPSAPKPSAPTPSAPAATPSAPEATPPPARVSAPGLEEVAIPAPSIKEQPIAEACRAELKLKPEPARAARLHFEIGQHATDTAAALKSYAAALEANPAFLPAIRAARALNLDMRNMSAAAKLYEAEIALTDEPRHKALLWFERGCAHLELDDDHDAAREAFRRAAKFDSTNATVLKALQHAELRAKDWPGLAEALSMEANAILDDRRHRAAVVTRYGRLLERRLRKGDAALEQFEIALALDPHTPVALAETKRILFAQGRWHELIGAHEREASLTQDDIVRAQAYWNIGRIYSERLDAKAEAIASLERAAELTADALILDELARLYVDAGDHDGAASALERLAAALKRPAERLSALHRLGELHQRARQDQKAIRWFEAAIAVDASYAPALSALDALYRRTSNWAALARMCVAEGGSKAPSRQRAAAYARAGDIFDAKLGRPDDAVAHYEQALSLDPHHEGAFKSLVRLHTAAQRHRALIELYDRAVDIAPREEIARAYMFKIGALYEDVLGEASGATATFLRILERWPDNLAAIHAVQRTAETSGRHQDLVAALDREAKLEKNRDRVLMLELRAAQVTHDPIGDSEAALARLQKIVTRDPKHAPAIEMTARIHEALGQPKELLVALELQLGITAQGPARVALLVRMAQLCETQLGDLDAAASWYQRAVSADPEHALARNALGRLLRAKGDHKELATMLSEEHQSATDPVRKARAALLLGETYEVHLAKPIDAVTAYRSAVEAVPGYQPALEALARVHTQASAWKDLVEVLTSQATTLGDLRLATDAQLRAAQLRADRLSRPDEAVAILDEVVTADSNNLAALLELEALHVERGERDRLEAVLTVESEVFGDAGSRVAAMVRQGILLQGSEEAAGTMRAVAMGVLAAEPANPWALSALEKLARESDDRQLLSDVEARYTEAVNAPSLKGYYNRRLGDSLLGTNASAALDAFKRALAHEPDNLSAIRGLAIVGRALGDAATMVDSYRREAEFTRDDRLAADLLVQSAAVLARLGDRQGATDDAESALARCPDHELASEMLRALLGKRELDRLIEQLTQAAHNARDVKRKVALWRTVGELHWRGKKDVATAISVVKRALVSDEDDVEALTQLAQLYVANDQHEEAAELLARAVKLDDGLLVAHLELARIYTDHLEDGRKARRAIDKVLASEPENRDALRMLLKLHLHAGKGKEAREVSSRLLDAAGDDDRLRAWALVEIARVELSADQSERAAQALHDAIVLEGVEGDAARLYRRMAGDSVPWAKYIKTLRMYLDAGKADKRQATRVYLEIARAQNSKLDRAGDAFRTLDEALGRVGDDPTIVLERAEMLGASGRPQEAAGEFAALVSRSPYVTEAWRGLTQVFQQQGRQTHAAMAASPLVVLGEATDVERNLASERTTRPGAARPGSFGEATMRLISAGGAEDDERAAAVFTAVADGIAKAFPVPYDLYGVRKGDRIKARSGHPMRNEIDRLASVFAVEEVDLYLHAALGGDVALELSNPPALMVPAYLADLPDAQRVFLLARPLAAIAAATQPAYKLPTDDVAMVLAAAVRRLVPDFEAGNYDEQALAVLADKLSPSWFSRGKVDEVVQRYYAEPVDAAAWAPTVAKTATRAAALLAGDLEACLAAMKYAGLVQGDKPSHELARQSPLLDDVLRFWVSDPANEARRLGGLI